jgi:hypothetical protein
MSLIVHKRTNKEETYESSEEPADAPSDEEIVKPASKSASLDEPAC